MSSEEEQGSQPTGVSIHTGFPNPAADTSLRSLDLNKLLIQHGSSTYFFRIRGDEWQDSGVFDGDVAIIDRALDARKADLVIWWHNDAKEFNISICKTVPEDANVWGVITATIHEHRKIITTHAD